MTERKPIQISGNFVLCDDSTLWKWETTNWFSGWTKLPPIPNDEDYENEQKERHKKFQERIEYFDRQAIAINRTWGMDK
jgi:hypothetical protein